MYYYFDLYELSCQDCGSPDYEEFLCPIDEHANVITKINVCFSCYSERLTISLRKN